MGLETATFLTVCVVVYGVNAAIAKDGEILAEGDFGDFDAGEEIWFLGAIEEVGEGGENCIVVIGVIPKLCNGLCDENVEPVQRLWLVGVDVVVCL